MLRFTIFTPTYNRSSSLMRLYQSLKKQTFNNFEWLVVDDGSTDETSKTLKEIINNENDINIKYVWQENGGKHRAINNGLNYANGQYFFIVDSDDYLTENSLEITDKWINRVENESGKFIGVAGLKGYKNGSYVGNTFDNEYIDCIATDRYRYKIIGDKSEVFRTDILKKYKFPEFNGENFITEAIVWNRIAKDGYLIRYFNEINYICEYLEDGLTSNIDMLYSKNFRGYTQFLAEYLESNSPLMLKVRAIIAYTYRAKLAKIPLNELSKLINKPIILLWISSSLGALYKKIVGIRRRSK